MKRFALSFVLELRRQIDPLGAVWIAAVLLASPALAAEPDPRDAVIAAMAVRIYQLEHRATTEAKPQTYRDLLEVSRIDQRNVVVFVNAKQRSFENTHTLAIDSFPGVKGSGIVVGVWHGGEFIRTDLPATATDKEIWAAIFAPPPSWTRDDPPVIKQSEAVARERAVAAYLSQALNRGRCECLTVGGCRCQPASACGREPCQLHNPLLSNSGTTIVPSVQSACPNGQCPSSQPARGGWYLGRRLGR